MPGATQIFADALFGGDVKQLFDQMEKGLVRMPELNKVIDFMATLKDDELMARMQKSPEKAMQRMNTAVTRLFMTLNDVGAIDAMVFVLDKLAIGVEYLSKIIKPASVWIGKFFTPIIDGLKGIWEYLAKPIVKGLGDLVSVISEIPYVAPLAAGGLLGLAAATTAASVATTPLAKSLKVIGLILRRFMLYPIIAAAALGLLLQVMGALQGNDNYFTKLTEQEDKGFLGWLAAGLRMATELAKLLGVVGIATGKFGVDMLKGRDVKAWNEALNEFIGVSKEAYAGFAETDRETGMSVGIQKMFSPEAQTTQGFDYSSLLQNQIPNLLAAPAKPSTVSNVFNTEIVVQGSGLNQQQMTAAFKDAMNTEAIKAKANWVMAR